MFVHLTDRDAVLVPAEFADLLALEVLRVFAAEADLAHCGLRFQSRQPFVALVVNIAHIAQKGNLPLDINSVFHGLINPVSVARFRLQHETRVHVNRVGLVSSLGVGHPLKLVQ